MRAIKIYNPDHLLYPAVCQCIKHKDLILTQAGYIPDRNDIVIQDKNIEIWGVTAIIQYIDEKYPHPPLFPNDPEKAAIIRMAIAEFKTKPLDKVLPIYAAAKPQKGFFSGASPSILDIYLYALTKEDPDWDSFRRNFEHERRGVL